MAQKHRDIFAEDDTLNLDRFKPKPTGASDRRGPQDLREIAERTKFVSREAKETPPPRAPLLRRGQHRTGRTATVTLKGTVKLADFETEFGNNLALEPASWTLNGGLDRALVA